MAAKTPLIKESLRLSTSSKRLGTASQQQQHQQQNYLKLPDINEHKLEAKASSENQIKTTLETIPERDTQILKIEDTNGISRDI